MCLMMMMVWISAIDDDDDGMNLCHFYKLEILTSVD